MARRVSSGAARFFDGGGWGGLMHCPRHCAFCLVANARKVGREQLKGLVELAELSHKRAHKTLNLIQLVRAPCERGRQCAWGVACSKRCGAYGLTVRDTEGRHQLLESQGEGTGELRGYTALLELPADPITNARDLVRRVRRIGRGFIPIGLLSHREGSSGSR